MQTSKIHSLNLIKMRINPRDKKLNIKTEYTSHKLIVILLFLSVVLISINGFPYGPAWLGELRVELAIWPLMMANIIAFYLILIRKFCVPRTVIFYALTVFFSIICLSFVINHADIQTNIFKGRTGLEKFSLQFILFIFMCLIVVTVFNVFNQIKMTSDRLKWIEYAVLSSLAIPVIYSVIIEIPSLLGFNIARQLKDVISPYLHEGLYPGRLRSVSGESSYFGSYIAFAFPWLLSATMDKRKSLIWGYVIFPAVLLMCYLSFSRTVYGVILAEIIIFTVILCVLNRSNARNYAWIRFISGTCIAIALVFLVNYASSDSYPGIMTEVHPGVSDYNADVRLGVSDYNADVRLGVSDYNESNTTRTLSVLTAFNIWNDNLVFGVGFGQYGFYFKNYLYEEGGLNGELERLALDLPNSQWPPVYNIFARIAAEIGLIGLLGWLSIWVIVFIGAIRIAISAGVEYTKGAALIVTVLGVFSIGIGFDSFRYIPYWLVMGMVAAFPMKKL